MTVSKKRKKESRVLLSHRHTRDNVSEGPQISNHLSCPNKRGQIIKYSVKKVILNIIKVLFMSGLVAAILGIAHQSILVKPNMQEPRWAFFSQDEFINRDQYKGVKFEKVSIDDLTEIIYNNNVKQSIIGVLMISIADGPPAYEVTVNFIKRVHRYYYEKGIVANSLVIDESCYSEEFSLNLKTFSSNRLVAVPVYITEPYNTGNEINDIEDYAKKRKIIVEYIPQYITFKSNIFRQIPLLNLLSFDYRENVSSPKALTTMN